MDFSQISLRQLKRTFTTPFGLIVAGLILLIIHQLIFRLGVGELIGDELTPYLTAASSLAQVKAGQLPNALFLYGQPPLRVFLALPAAFLASQSEVLVRLPHIILGLLSVWLMLIIVKPLGRMATLVLLLLVLGSGFLIISRVAMAVSAFMFFSLFAYWAWDTYLRKEMWWWGGLAWLGVALASLTYLEGVFFIPGLLLWSLFANPKLWKRLTFYTTPVVVLLLFTPFLYAWFRVPIEYARATGAHLSELGGHRIIGRGSPRLGNYIPINFRILVQYSSVVFASVTVAFMGIGLFQKRWWGLVSTAALPILYFVFLVENPTVHILNFLPFILLLATIGIATTMRWWPRYWIQSSLIVLIVIVTANAVSHLYRDYLTVSAITDQSQYTWGQNTDIGLREVSGLVREDGGRYYSHFLTIDATAAAFYIGRYPVHHNDWENPEINYFLLDPQVKENDPVFAYCQTRCREVKRIIRGSTTVMIVYRRIN